MTIFDNELSCVLEPKPQKNLSQVTGSAASLGTLEGQCFLWQKVLDSPDLGHFSAPRC